MNTGFQGEVRRYDQPNIIATNRQLASILGVVLAYNATGYAPGQVLARNSVSGLYEKYDDNAASGLNTAKAILLDKVEATDFASANDSAAAAACFGGEVYKNNLTGLDANGITDLAAKTVIVAGGTEILKF